MTDLQAYLPGRLGDAAMRLETDPRSDPRVVAVMQALGGGAAPPPPGADASLEACLDYCQQFEDGDVQTHAAQWATMPSYDDVEQTTETIRGVDGNDITLFVHQPKNSGADPRPCVVHTHGGGMVLMAAADPGFVRWRNELARRGMVVVGVEFRNGGGRLGNHPFPAGLNDCASGFQWAAAQKDTLGISNLILSGESGGGNLSIATTLKAKREGWLDQISGVFAMCPYIYGGYGNPDPALLSLVENNEYMLACDQMHALVRVYDPAGEHTTNPLAWPYHASTEELSGLPPHVISVNELDPLRDEGLAYYRKLLAAGVTTTARMIPGTPHAGDVMLPDITPEHYAATADALCAFARSVAP